MAEDLLFGLTLSTHSGALVDSRAFMTVIVGYSPPSSSVELLLDEG